MYGVYLLTVVILLLVAYAGVEETLRVVRYIDLSINYQIVMWKMRRMKRQLERDMGKPPRDWESEFDDW